MVEEAGTPEVRLKTVEENLEWLLLDPYFRRRLITLLNYPNYTINISDHPVYYMLDEGQRHQYTTPISVVQAADLIASQIETFTTRIVTNIEKFGEQVARIIEGSRGGEGRSETSRPVFSVSCACVSCACACACVSCACACASGGAG